MLIEATKPVGVPLNLIDRGRLLSPGLLLRIHRRSQKLARFFPGVQQCRVRVDGPGRHPRHGRFRIRIDLTVSGTEIAINRRTGEDLEMAIRDSFDAADQRLEDHARRRTRTSKRAKRAPARGPSRRP